MENRRHHSELVEVQKIKLRNNRNRGVTEIMEISPSFRNCFYLAIGRNFRSEMVDYEPKKDLQLFEKVLLARHDFFDFLKLDHIGYLKM